MDNNNLHTLRILYIIKGILSILSGLVVLSFMGFGGAMMAGQDFPQDEIPFNPAVIVSGMGLFFFLIFLAMGIVNLFAAKFIKERRNHTFVFVAAIFNCLSGLLGLGLGIFTLIEIQKNEVKQLFGGNTP